MTFESPTTPRETSPSTLRSGSARERLSTLFPDPNAPAPPWWQRRRRAIAVVVIVALVASSVLAARAFAASDASYRTALVAKHDVDTLLNGVATIEPVAQSSVAFPAAGTVAAVNVKVGDSVTVGQALASLDPVTLDQTLHEKQAALAQAELALEQALRGETPANRGGDGTNPVGLTATTPKTSDPAMAAAQQSVLAAQRKVDEALHTASNALDAAATVCATVGVGSSAPTTPTTEQLTACQTATKDVLTAQTAVRTAEQELAEAARTLDDLIAEQASNPSSSDGSTGGPANDVPAHDAPAGSDSSSGSSSAATSPSSADLVAYQKAVDAAESEVAVAEQAIAQATIVSPIAGTVEAVNVKVGDSVDAASTTATIVVVGAGGFEATTLVSVDDITDVKVGQHATLLPDGSKQPLDGTVSSISLAPDPAASTTSYRVIIGLTASDAKLNNGSTGSLAIVTESARAGLAVPTSAVTTTGERHMVTVLDGDSTERVVVQVGVVGETWTEITSGLTAGRQVVLADISEPLPGSATESSGTDTQLPNGLKFPIGGPPGGFSRSSPVGK